MLCYDHTLARPTYLLTELDLHAQSTDKNFLVPVGGAVVATCSKEHGRPLLKKVGATGPATGPATDPATDPATGPGRAALTMAMPWLCSLQVSATYPGRASVSPILDLFCTLLHLGADGWAKLLADRQALMPPFRVQLAALAERHGERLLHTPNNTISMALTLSSEAGGLYSLWLYLPWLYLPRSYLPRSY